MNSEGFVKASQTFYKKPESGSKQDNFTKDDIKKQLKGYTRLNSEELQYLPAGLHIKYFNHKDKKFRCGGYLAKVSYPDYIVLKNYFKKLIWSVQIKDNYFFIKEETKPNTPPIQKAHAEKDRLYELYKAGKLTLKE